MFVQRSEFNSGWRIVLYKNYLLLLLLLCLQVAGKWSHVAAKAWNSYFQPEAGGYHWPELPQVSFLSRQTRECCDKTSFVVTKICLPRKTFVTAKIMFVMTNTSVMTKLWSLQNWYLWQLLPVIGDTYLQQKTHLLAQARLGVVSMQRWLSMP